MYFVDASALVKRYVRETGSRTVQEILDSHAVAISRLSEIEVPSALARRAARGDCLHADATGRLPPASLTFRHGISSN